MPRDSDYCGGGYETRISDNGTTTNTSWGDCGSGPVINITGGSNSSRDYPSGSGRGDHNSHENSHGTGSSNSGGRGRDNYESKGNGFSSSENSLAVSVAQSTNFMVKQLKPGEWSLGINTASWSGRKSKDIDGISNQAKGCFDHIKGNGGIDTLRLLTFRECDLTEIDMIYYCNRMAEYSALFNYLDFSYNRINDSGISCLFNNAFIPSGTYAKHVVNLNLSNNNLGNDSAIIISNAIANGQLTATNYLNLSGNKITPPGETKLVQALKGVGQDIAIFTHTLDEIVKMTDGSREEKVAIFRSLIEKGKAIGTYDEAIVVDKSFLGKLSNVKKEGLFGIEWLFGFGKCHLLPEPEKVVESYAQDKIIATLPTKTASGLNFAKKYVGKLLSFHDVITCFVSSREDALTSEMGQQVLAHELCLLGEEEFCGE